MNAKDELNQALLVLRKYNLPISPILVCAIEELIDSLPKDQIKSKSSPEVSHSNKYSNISNKVISYNPRTDTPPRVPKSLIQVTFPDGRVICENKTKDTVEKVIIAVGIEKVAHLCDIVPENSPLLRNRVKLVTKSLHPKYGNRQHLIRDDWRVFDGTNNPDKVKQIQAISDGLGLNLKIDYVTEATS